MKKNSKEEIKEYKQEIKRSKWVRGVMNKNDINLLIKHMYEESINIRK